MRISIPRGDSRIKDGTRADNMDLQHIDIKMSFKATGT